MKCKRPYLKTPVGVKSHHVVLSESARLAATPIPCGQCSHCRLQRARVLANRILLEQMVCKDACFITLTYDDESIDTYEDLVKSDLQTFNKNFRYRVGPFRYYAVGEYGLQNYRPHYHIMAFGVPLNKLSEKLVEKTWNKGFIHIGECNKDTARYIAHYIFKGWTDPDYWMLANHSPEFSTSSLRPGIGAPAIDILAELVNKKKLEYSVNKNLNKIRIGKKEVSIGRYLSERFNRLVGTDKNLIEGEWYGKQREYFDKYIDDTGKTNIFDNLLEDNASVRLSEEKRQKIFRSRRSL